MTINAPAAIVRAMYIVVAEQQGVPGNTSPAPSKTTSSKNTSRRRSTYTRPESVRLITDTIEFATHEVPRYNPISITGYHIREAGSTAVQELAFTLATVSRYVERALARGLDIDDFAGRLSFFFNAHMDFFETIAKYRAARRIWAHVVRERFGAKEERSWKLRFHTQTAGCSLTWQQPYNNVVRTTLQALAAVLGGTQSLHTNSLDEAYALPGEQAVTLALRTQQVIAHESGVTGTADPLGGSFFLERLTSDVETAATGYSRRIDEIGGMIPAIEAGFPQREIAQASFEYQQAVESGARKIVGVNAFAESQVSPLNSCRLTTARPNSSPQIHRPSANAVATRE